MKENSRSRSRHRNVSYQGQTDPKDVDENASAGKYGQLTKSNSVSRGVSDSSVDPGHLSPSFVPIQRDQNDTFPANGDANVPQLILPGTNVTLDSPTATRPKADGIAFPFKLGKSQGSEHDNASMLTLKSGVVTAATTPAAEAGEDQVGLGSIMVSENTMEEGAQDGNGPVTTGEAKAERPQPERFETAREEL